MNYTSRFDNKLGREVFRFQQVVNCAVRGDIAKPIETDNVQDKTEKPKEDEIDAVEAIETSNTSDEIPLDDLNHLQKTEDISKTGTIRQRWRLISAVQAWPSSAFPHPQLVDYSYENGNALRGAINAVNSTKPDLVWNHSYDAHDVAGYVENASWEDSTDIPVGVNADLVVDSQFDTKAAIGLAKGFIRNGSIGITMDCVPSHPKMPLEAFTQQQGEVVNNELVRWLPIEIFDVRHMALVAAGTGADPNAGRRDVMNQSKEIQEPLPEEPKNTGGKMNEEMLALFASLAQGLGVEVALSEEGKLPEGLDERLTKKIEKLTAFGEKYNKLVAQTEQITEMLAVDTFDNAIDAISEKVELAKHGQKLLEHYRKEAARWFDAAKTAAGKTDLNDSEKRMRARITKSDDLDYLEDITAEYREITETQLSSARTSAGQELAVDKKTDIDFAARDIAASVAKMFK